MSVDSRNAYLTKLSAALNRRAEAAVDPEDKWRLGSAATRITDHLLGIRPSWREPAVLASLPYLVDARDAHATIAEVCGSAGINLGKVNARTSAEIDELLIASGWKCVVDAMADLDSARSEGNQPKKPTRLLPWLKF